MWTTHKLIERENSNGEQNLSFAELILTKAFRDYFALLLLSRLQLPKTLHL